MVKIFVITQYEKAQEYVGVYISKMQVIHEKFLNTRQPIYAFSLFLEVYKLCLPIRSMYFICYFMNINIPSLALFIFWLPSEARDFLFICIENVIFFSFAKLFRRKGKNEYFL